MCHKVFVFAHICCQNHLLHEGDYLMPREYTECSEQVIQMQQTEYVTIIRISQG